MRCHKTLLAIAVIFALSAPIVLAGDHGEKKTSDEDLTRIEGEIYRVYTRTIMGNETLMLDVDTADRPRRTVCVGVIDTEMRQEMDLDDGEMVTVKGETIIRDNGEAVFIAHELHRGDDQWMLKKHHERHGMM